MDSVRTSKGKSVAINPIVRPIATYAIGAAGKPMAVQSARLTIRSDEAVRRTISDTDGTVRRARQVAETNRLFDRFRRDVRRRIKQSLEPVTPMA